MIVDVPDARLADNPDWAVRRAMAADWARALAGEAAALGLARVTLAWYRNAGGNNADLPRGLPSRPGRPRAGARRPAAGSGHPLRPALRRPHHRHGADRAVGHRAAEGGHPRPGGFRAATMPGFLPSMIPALRLDYGEINRRVNLLKELLDRADRAVFRFEALGHGHDLQLDLRHRTGHASGGLFPANGVAGNLPSGEAYIVPYEGERAGDPSASEGTLPVQIDGEVVVYRIAGNKAVEVMSEGPVSAAEAARIAAEPAYANLAELGLGVLGDFGLEPSGEHPAGREAGPAHRLRAQRPLRRHRRPVGLQQPRRGDPPGPGVHPRDPARRRRPERAAAGAGPGPRHHP